MVLAKLFGARQIDFIGMDGFKSDEHYFQNGKSPPPFNNTVKFQEQMEVFCEYLFEGLGCKKEHINNLGKEYPESIYAGILERYNK